MTKQFPDSAMWDSRPHGFHWAMRTRAYSSARPSTAIANPRGLNDFIPLPRIGANHFGALLDQLAKRGHEFARIDDPLKPSRARGD